MAGVLAASSINVAGGTVFAEEQQASQEELVVEEGSDTESNEEVSGNSEVNEKDSKGEVASVTEESNGENDKEAEESSEENAKEVEDTNKESPEESEEDLEEVEDVEEDEDASEKTDVTVENVELIQIYGEDVKFDSASNWDAKEENHLGISTEKALNRGATVSFDLYIPEDAADYNGLIKVQGIARLGKEWLWTECGTMPEIGATDLTETVEVDGNLYKKVSVSYTFGSEIEKDYLADFTVKLAGWQCDYDGAIYYGNVEVVDGEAVDTPEEEEDTLVIPEGYSAFYGKEVTFDSTSEWDDQGEQNLGLKSDAALASGTKVSFDMLIPEEAAKFNGIIKVQGVARLGSNWAWTQNEVIPEFTAGDFSESVEIDGTTYKKTTVSFTFGEEIETDYLANFTVKLAGWMCDYEGVILYSNVELEAVQQEIVLTQFYDDVVEFNAASDWDDKGEHQMDISSETALKSGAAVSFDMLVPADAEYSGVIKVQGIARLGDDWNWTQNAVIPEFSSDSFTGTIEVDGVEYKKAKVSFTFGDEITTDYLANFTVKLAGWQCDYAGPIYYTNLELVDGAGAIESTVLHTWDFATGIDGWYYDGTWDNDGDNSIEWNEGYEALQMNVDYSLNADSTWSEIKASFWGDDFLVSGVNKLTFDFIYDSAALTTGSFKAKAFSNSGVNTDVNINLDNAEDYDGTLKKVQVSLSFDEKDIENGITIGIIGYETDYQGVVYLDNVSLVSEVSEEAEYYVDSTVTPIGQEVQLAVEGTTLVTGAGSSEIATNVTLVDANATDDVKQIYAYLQAVGQTDSVIFGQQNNTSHKAGNSNLSNSDTMDVVGSYAGVIGLDGLSLTGDEYSAVRYLAEMDGVDSAYDTVAAKINAASTVAEQNVIAAAALTNYNIRNGAIATLSIHTPNLSKVDAVSVATDAPSYANYDFSGYTPGDLSGDVMNNILPGGAYNDEFTAYLDMIADYASQVDGAILFRPFHENTGSWFWWGAALCDAETYKSVYKYTVEYLRDEKGIHNLLYVYGPGSEAANVEEYAERYPGDGYVDMVGFDMYHDNPTEGDTFIASFTSELNVVESFAKQHGKLVAVTETGARHDTADGDNQTALLKQGNARKDWHQEIIDVVESSDASYYLVWANFSEKDGFYTPYVKSVNEDGSLHGHEMMDNFINFFNENNSVFAVNQQSALEQMKSVEISATAALEQDGYIVSPIAGARILEETSIMARVTGVSEDDEITFVCTGESETCTLEAQVTNGYAVATLTADDLAAMGETVGTITLQINKTAVQTVSVMFNVPEPEEDPYEIDGFENYYGVDSQLTKSWTTNKASGSTISITLDSENVNEGDYAMKFTYNETSDGWAGATISKEVSWADCDALSFWTIPDGNAQKTVIQITASGNVYEYYMNLNEDYVAAGTNAVYVTIPFSEFVARDITGNPAGGLVEDKDSITSFGLWVNAIGDSDAVVDGMVSGTIYYDSITAVTAGLETAQVVLAETDEPEVDEPETDEPEEDKPGHDNKPGNSGNNNGGNNKPGNSGNNNSGNNKPSNGGTQNNKKHPAFVDKNGKEVKGWKSVIKAAFEMAELEQSKETPAGTPDAEEQKISVHIDLTNVTELVIPKNVIAEMVVTGADYNFVMDDVVITLTPEILQGLDGEIDLKLYERNIEDFGVGFSAKFISSRTTMQFEQKADMNVVLGEEKVGKQAYLYTYNEEAHSYDFIGVQTVSEIGTVCIPVDTYASCLILF